MSGIEKSLRWLADTAWANRKVAPDSTFVLLSEQLPAPSTAADMQIVVERFYAHGRKWAPGFESPYSIPSVSVSSQIDAPGQYRADGKGDLFIEVSRSFAKASGNLLRSGSCLRAGFLVSCDSRC